MVLPSSIMTAVSSGSTQGLPSKPLAVTLLKLYLYRHCSQRKYALLLEASARQRCRHSTWTYFIEPAHLQGEKSLPSCIDACGGWKRCLTSAATCENSTFGKQA